MTDNTNIVKKWASNMLSDANYAISCLNQMSPTSVSVQKAMGAVGEIKGCCEAIIAAMEGTESK